jgi:hypothetical protein
MPYVEKRGVAKRQPLFLLAPRPGLEPGTYGLTGKQARQKPIKINDLLAILINV